MASYEFRPYVSEFEYESRFHPSKNPNCAVGWSGNLNDFEDEIYRRDFYSRYKRSPEEDPPVGQEPSIEIRAILVRCLKPEEETDDTLINRHIYNITAGRSQDILDFHGCDRDEPMRHSQIRDCRRKLVITMRFNNIGKTKTEEEFVVIDHVLDPVTMHKARLLNPFVVKVRQEPVLQLYGLKFQGVVNAEAREEVMNNEQSNYTGCRATSENPTCGQMFFEDKPIPYSQGFCCSCDPDVNIQRQSSVVNETVSPSFSNFFSKSKVRHIRPFKSVRSRKADSPDAFSDFDEINELPASKGIGGNIIRSSKNANFQQNFNPNEEDSIPRDNYYEEERDLIKLKNFKNKNARHSSILMFDKIADKNQIEVYDPSREISSSLMETFSTAKENPRNFIDNGRNTQTNDKQTIYGSGGEYEDDLSKRKSSINTIDELTKLEKDYNNSRRSSKLRDEERRAGTNVNIRFNIERTTLKNEIYSRRRLNVNDGENFYSINSAEKKVHPTAIFAVEPIFKSIINRDDSPAPLWNSRSSEILEPGETRAWTISEAQTAAILWQKLASDRIYPSSERNHVYSRTKTIFDRKTSHPAELMMNYSKKFNRNAADFLSNILMADQLELPSYDNVQPGDNQSVLADGNNAKIFEASTAYTKKNYVEITPISESTITIARHDVNDFTTRFDEPYSRAENSTDASLSFSSGNHTKNDAIAVSGSLRNQLGNGFTYNERRQYEVRGARKNPRENYDQKIEFENKDEVEARRAAALTNGMPKKHAFNDDPSNGIIANQKPVQIYLETRYDRKSSGEIRDDETSSKIGSNDRNLSPGISLNYRIPEKVDMRETNSKHWNIPRSYRSIAENDPLFISDNDRQRNIDKRIEDKFEEISDLLKDAGEGSKIIRQKPKSNETFEKDNSVMEKYASFVESSSKGSKENVANFKARIPLDIVNISKSPENKQNRAILKRFKQRKFSDPLKISHDSHKHLVSEKDYRDVQKLDTILDRDRKDEPTAEKSRSHVGNRKIASDIVKHTEEYSEPVSEMLQTTGHKIVIDRFKLINNYKEMPENYGQPTGFTNVPPKVRNLIRKQSTTGSFDPATAIKSTHSTETISKSALITDQKSPTDVSSNFRKSIDVSQKNENEVWRNASLSHVSSPVFMIENLKKQLRKEAESFSSSSGSRNIKDRKNSRKAEGHWKYANEVREVNTELTPAEKVEDLIAVPETLPPDGETNYTIPFSQLAQNIRSSLTTPLSSESTISNSTVFPRFAIRNARKHHSPKGKSHKVFLPFEESLPSFSASVQRSRNGNHKKSRIHRRRLRYNKKHSAKNKRDQIWTTASQSSIKHESEKVNIKNGWYDAKIQKAMTASKDPAEHSTTKLRSSTAPINSGGYETRRRRYDEKMLNVLEHNHQIDHRGLKDDQQLSNPGEMWLSVIGTPHGDGHSIIEASSTKNTSKPVEINIGNSEDRAEPNFDVKSSTHNLPLDPNKQVPIVQDPVSSGNDTDDKKVQETTKVEVITRRSWRYLQTLSSRKFPSFYPKSSDIIAMSENGRSIDNAVNGNDGYKKRDNLIDVNESGKESVVFYDYEDEGKSIDDDVNSDGKRSLDNFVPEEIIGGIEPWEGWKDKMELLKLKKHADVLKEYLNWRHDVAPPEPNGISGYTTEISMLTNSPEVEEGYFITTSLSDANTTEYIHSTVTEILKSSYDPETEDVTSKSSCNQNYITTDTTTNSGTESSSTTIISCGDSNVSDNLSTTEKITSVDCFSISANNNTTMENPLYEEETSTGRILPPCDSNDGFSENLDAIVTTESNVYTIAETAIDALPTVISDHQAPSNNINNDLIVISILEKSLRGNTNLQGRNENRDSPAKIYKIQEELKAEPDSRQRRHKFKRKYSSRNSHTRHKRLPCRRLMFIHELDENYDQDVNFVANEENKYVDLSNNMETDNSGINEDSSILTLKWNHVIDKIMNENTTKSADVENTNRSLSKYITDDNRSVLNELHFFNADKYINKIAKKIVHNSNDHDLKFDEIKGSHQKASLVGRKLKQYPDKSMLQLRLEMADPQHNGHDATNPSLNSVHENDISDVASHSKRFGRERKGRDFAISLSGNIHVEGGTNGQPMSISFDTLPDVVKTNETLRLTTNETINYANETKVDAEKPPNTDVLSGLFNIATVPEELRHVSQKDDKNSTSNLPLFPSVRSTRDNNGQKLTEQGHKMFLDFVNKVPNARKRRAIHLESARRHSKIRNDRSYNPADSQSPNNVKNSEDHLESSNEDEYDHDYHETNDFPAASFNHKFFESGQRSAAVEGSNRLSPEVGVIKVIPLNMEEPSASFSTLETGVESQENTKKSRMIASHLPTMINENVPGTTVRTGKIMPAELPWREHEYDAQNFGSSISESHPPNRPEDQSNALDDFSLDQSTSTSDPMNLRVMDLSNMGQPTKNEKQNFNTNYDSKYKIVPLIHVKIQQQSDSKGSCGHNFVIPLENNSHGEGCPKIEMTHPKDVVNDNSLCPHIDDPCNKVEDENISRKPQITTQNLSNDERFEEIFTESDDTQRETSPFPEVPTPCDSDRTTSRLTSTPNSLDKTDSRKKIRMKNMLAIVEFMQKINKLMSIDGSTDVLSDDYNDAIIKLERVIIWPGNRSDNLFRMSEQAETTTRRVVIIGEGVTHLTLDESTACEENGGPSKNKELNDQNENFLFHEEDQDNKDIGYIPEFDGSRNLPSLEMKKNPPSFGHPVPNSADVSVDGPDQQQSYTETMAESRSEESDVSRDSKRKIKDRFHDNEAMNVKNPEKKIRYIFGNKRKAMKNDFFSHGMMKRHRSLNDLPSYRNGYDYRDERRAGGQMDRIKSSNGLLDRTNDEKLGRFVAAQDIPREKRKRKKKRRRKKKRKNKRKKGRNRTSAAKKSKSWWPFKRQLMSLNGKRHVILDSNFERRQVRRVKAKNGANPRTPFSLAQRNKRKVHPVNYAHGEKKNMKKHPKPKKGKKKKNKNKKTTKRREDTSGRNKRQINPGGTQTRGGQDCMNRRHPSNVDPVKYLESAHCLRFNDLWYSVYELENPIMEHTVYLQLFEKHSLPDGTTHWDDLTQGTMVRMGTFTRHQRDDKPTIAFTYSGAKIETQNRALNLDPTRQRLLVPSPVPPNKASQYSGVRGPGEYLVVKANTISKDGKECDKAGVSFAAFAKQEDRCGRTKGSCLKNQPLAHWRHDMEARNSGRPGCYLLSNFATVPTNPIKYNVSGTGSREYLGLEYHSAHVSVVDIEVRTDYNAIVRVGSSGRVTEVYVDSTSQEHTVVTVVISNMGLASSPYQPRIADCPTGLPISWTKAKGIMQVIPPQHDQRITLDLYGQLLLNGFHCSVEVVNHRGELVAMRRIRVQKMDRCFCVWHCLCACIGSVSGLGCQPMSPEHYHAAGFQGPVPVISTESSWFINAVKDILMLSALLVLLLLLLGLLKWFVGIFAPSVGRWGLDSLLEGSKIEEYFESELRCRCVVTDDNGLPVHPDTGQRTVRLCSRKLEFILNVIFFLTYPIAMCCGHFKRSLQSLRQRRCCPDESKMCLINDKSTCPKLICVSTYGDSRNSKLEAEDTRYVMNELKRSQESLQHPKGTKKKNGRKSDKGSSRKSSRRNKSTLDVTAKSFVANLLKKRTVFRNLTEPIGGLAVPIGITYSLRGYFFNTENGGYRFITPCPFKQYWLIERNQKTPLKPPKIYSSSLFMSSFDTARDVYESKEISLIPKGICINAQHLDDD